MDELIYESAATLAREIRQKRVSSEEVINAHLQRIEEVNPKLNAVVQTISDTARKQAREADAALARGEFLGPLHGVPFTVKDNIESEGVICTGGTLGRSSYVPEKDSVVVARMRGAGGILIGKTNVPELALAGETDNLVYGRTNNPYGLDRTPGGSSGGEGALIAAGGSPVGLGSDIGGSVRIPAHYCGIAGIKPTSCRVPRTGHYPRLNGALDSLFQIGPMSRYVEDLTLTMPIVSGIDYSDPAIVPMPLGDPGDVELKSLRGSFHTDNGVMPPTPETAETVKKIAGLLSDAGIDMEEARPTGVEKTGDIENRFWGAQASAGVEALLEEAGTSEAHTLTTQVVDFWRQFVVPSSEFAAIHMELDDYRSGMLSFFEPYDVIICPTIAFPAPPHGVSWNEDFMPGMTYTSAYNLTGWPCVIVRAGTSPEGLPIGVQVVAQPWRDDVALAVAQHIETVTGGWQKPEL